MRVMNEIFTHTIHHVMQERWPGLRMRNLSPAALDQLHREVRERLARMPMDHAWRWN
jgi:hypothetical protein